MMMNLFFHQAALGDFVLTFPLLRLLAPEPTLVVAPRAKARLAGAVFPHVIPIDIESHGMAALHASLASQHGANPEPALKPPIPRVLQPYQSRITQVISFVSDGSDAWAINVAGLLPSARLHFKHPRPPAERRIHVCDWHMEQLGWETHTQTTNDNTQQIQEGTPSYNRSSSAPVLIHPGSGGTAKCWPRERFETLIAKLRSCGVRAIPLLGEVEQETWPAEVIDRWQSAFDAQTPATLEELRQLLLTGRLFLGNDSGPTHLAAQLGVPTIALFGPTDPLIWSPRPANRHHNSVCVIAPPSPRAMEWLQVEAVIDAVRRCTDEIFPGRC